MGTGEGGWGGGQVSEVISLQVYYGQSQNQGWSKVKLPRLSRFAKPTAKWHSELSIAESSTQPLSLSTQQQSLLWGGSQAVPGPGAPHFCAGHNPSCTCPLQNSAANL